MTKYKPKFKEMLYDRLDGLATYHDDIRCKKKDSIQTMLENFFYWVDEYNDGFLGNDFNYFHEGGNDDLYYWLVENYYHMNGEIYRYIESPYRNFYEITEVSMDENNNLTPTGKTFVLVTNVDLSNADEKRVALYLQDSGYIRDDCSISWEKYENLKELLQTYDCGSLPEVAENTLMAFINADIL